MSLQTLKVLSLLLSYPEAEMLEALDEMAAVVDRKTCCWKTIKNPCWR
jgi:hypothetical protein